VVFGVVVVVGPGKQNADVKKRDFAYGDGWVFCDVCGKGLGAMCVGRGVI
jgi:Cys-tRNA synthase (O-phospho-L-seryl-tRNA:Cys-tRNA synthase)